MRQWKKMEKMEKNRVRWYIGFDARLHGGCNLN